MNDGGPAFPTYNGSGDGMTLRDYFASEAPISMETVKRIWGDVNVDLNNDGTRKAFFGVWALLRYEYADQMIAQREKLNDL